MTSIGKSCIFAAWFKTNENDNDNENRLKMKLVEYLRLKRNLRRRMADITETMELRKAMDVYAKYVCKMRGWPVLMHDGYSLYFAEVSFAFMNGYCKALHDNGFEFRNGLVKSRDITEDMPCGALEYYRSDAIAETKQKAVDTLRTVLYRIESSKENVNTIVSAFEKEIIKDS